MLKAVSHMTRVSYGVPHTSLLLGGLASDARARECVPESVPDTLASLASLAPPCTSRKFAPFASEVRQTCVRHEASVANTAHPRRVIWL